MALIGYARVSTTDQNLEPQVDTLKSAGCETVFEDVISGAKAERPGLNDALVFLRRGDTLVVWKLECLWRSMKHLVETVTTLGDRSVGFRSLMKGVDTTTTSGTLVIHLFGALAQFERDLSDLCRAHTGRIEGHHYAWKKGWAKACRHPQKAGAGQSLYQRWIDRTRGRSAPQSLQNQPLQGSQRNPTKAANVPVILARAGQ